jgi:CRISPR system Cascade subunit CasC
VWFTDVFGLTRKIPMSVTVSIHRIVSLPLCNPNRGMDGLPKTMYYGGVLRSRVSSQCIKAALRDEFDPGSIGLDATVRSTVVAQKRVAPGLIAKGLSEPEAVAATNALMALFVGERDSSPASAGSSEDVISEDDEKKGSAKKGKRDKNQPIAVEDLATSAPLVLGEREIEALIEVAYAYAKFGAGHDLRKLVEGKSKPQGPLGKAIEALHAIKVQAGLDGALFGRMSTGVAISRVDSAVAVAHAMGVGAVQSVADAWTAQDQLRDTPGAGHISTRELIAGVFLMEVYINVDDLRRNIGLSPDQEHALIEMIVASVLRWQPVAMVGSTAPHADPGEALITIGEGQPLSLARVYERPCEHVTEAAWERLIAHSEKMWARAGRPDVVLTLEQQGSVDGLARTVASAAVAAPVFAAAE